eukprot:scaffold2026_cov82-Isochrysis_galbana.AAC.2
MNTPKQQTHSKLDPYCWSRECASGSSHSEMSSSVMGAFGSRLDFRRLASAPVPSACRGRGGGGRIRPAPRPEAGRAVPWGEGEGCSGSRGDWRSVEARSE